MLANLDVQRMVVRAYVQAMERDITGLRPAVRASRSRGGWVKQVAGRLGLSLVAAGNLLRTYAA